MSPLLGIAGSGNGAKGDLVGGWTVGLILCGTALRSGMQVGVACFERCFVRVVEYCLLGMQKRISVLGGIDGV